MNVDTTSFLNLDETLKMGERILSFSNVRGGTIYNRIGEPLATFGQPPNLSMRSFQREGIRYFSSSDESYLDIYYPTEVTGLANPIILRLDERNVSFLLKERLEKKMIAIIFTAFISALGITYLLSLTIVRPVLRLCASVLSATDNPNEASGARLNWERGDELGDVAKALDILFSTVSMIYQEDLSTGQGARLQSAFPVLTYDIAWRLVSANGAALNLFAAASLNEIKDRHENFIRRKKGDLEQSVSPKELTHGESLTKIVNVATPNGIKRCIMNAVVVQKKTGVILRTIITLVDITKLAAQIESLKAKTKELEFEKESLSTSTMAAKDKLAEMKSVFQSCLILLTNMQKSWPSRIAPQNANEATGSFSSLDENPTGLSASAANVKSGN